MGVFKTSPAFESLRNMAVWVVKDGVRIPVWHEEPGSRRMMGVDQKELPPSGGNEGEQAEVSSRSSGGPPPRCCC